MRYEILGSVRVVDGDEVRYLTAHKVEIIFAALLASADRVVSADQLITEAWGSTPPRKALPGLHVYVSQLRKFLHQPGTDSPVATQPPGYLLRVEPGEADFREFLGLLERGRVAARNEHYEEAIDLCDQALALWRGPAVGDLVQGPVLRAFALWLEEARSECTELRAECALHLGRHREVIGGLYSLCNEYPLREKLYQQLMLALYQSGRRADALTVFRSARHVFAVELGLEPCRALQELQQAIIDDDVPVAPAFPRSRPRALSGAA
jgi:DNA-binding SARP family transcriptional activator